MSIINKKLHNGRRLWPIERVFIFTVLIGPIIHFAIFWVFVNVRSFAMAFQLPTGEWSMLSMKTVIGDIISGGSTLLNALRNTFIFFSIQVITIPFHVLIAYFMYRKIKWQGFFQVCFYLPSIISTLVICQVFQDTISPDGPLGAVLQKFGVAYEEIPWLLQNSDYAMKTLVFYSLWVGWGGHMLLLGGSLTRIPVEVLESARIDGINSVQEIFKMVFPLLSTTLVSFLILSLTGLLTASGPILVMTKGLYNTSTLSYWIYDKLYFGGKAYYNEVSAMGLVFTLIGVPIILLIRKMLEKIETVEY